jgi:hypothetical protein
MAVAMHVPKAIQLALKRRESPRVHAKQVRLCATTVQKVTPNFIAIRPKICKIYISRGVENVQRDGKNLQMRPGLKVVRLISYIQQSTVVPMISIAPKPLKMQPRHGATKANAITRTVMIVMIAIKIALMAVKAI